MEKDTIILKIKKNKHKIEVNYSQLEIIIDLISEYFDKNDIYSEKELVKYLIKHFDCLELGGSQFDILCDIILTDL